MFERLEGEGVMLNRKRGGDDDDGLADWLSECRNSWKDL
jgi:hypothetical protein